MPHAAVNHCSSPTTRRGKGCKANCWPRSSRRQGKQRLAHRRTAPFCRGAVRQHPTPPTPPTRSSAKTTTAAVADPGQLPPGAVAGPGVEGEGGEGEGDGEGPSAMHFPCMHFSLSPQHRPLHIFVPEAQHAKWHFLTSMHFAFESDQMRGAPDGQQQSSASPRFLIPATTEVLAQRSAVSHAQAVAATVQLICMAGASAAQAC
mmetsp:Transcript_6328/g.16114  ORF Transcript_6328/g.16114 Transcript_6328/m.16114 type:complete len:204 (+) Transcript_6328:56-667(+)